MYFEKGSDEDLDVALEFYERSQAIRLSTTDGTGAAYGNTAFNIALVYQEQGLKGKQCRHAQKAMDAYIAVYGADHPDTKQARALRNEALTPEPKPMKPMKAMKPKQQHAPAKTKDGGSCCVIS